MFLTKKEEKITKDYLKNGYVIHNIENLESLNWIRNYYCQIIKQKLPKIKEKEEENILNNIHKYVQASKLNKFRLDIINKINSEKNFRENYYKVSKCLTDVIVGNEIAMQMRISLSIQLPKDNS